MKPSKTALILGLLGCALLLTGLAFKLNHLMGAETAFNAGVALIVIGLVTWVIQLVRGK